MSEQKHERLERLKELLNFSDGGHWDQYKNGYMQAEIDCEISKENALINLDQKLGREHESKLSELQKENAALTRKGEELCQAYGISLLEIIDLKKENAALKEVLEKIREIGTKPDKEHGQLINIQAVIAGEALAKLEAVLGEKGNGR